jgi:hypothetical protein
MASSHGGLRALVGAAVAIVALTGVAPAAADVPAYQDTQLSFEARGVYPGSGVLTAVRPGVATVSVSVGGKTGRATFAVR